MYKYSFFFVVVLLALNYIFFYLKFYIRLKHSIKHYKKMRNLILTDILYIITTTSIVSSILAVFWYSYKGFGSHWIKYNVKSTIWPFL
jgi:hypothetical protein